MHSFVSEQGDYLFELSCALAACKRMSDSLVVVTFAVMLVDWNSVLHGVQVKFCYVKI